MICMPLPFIVIGIGQQLHHDGVFFSLALLCFVPAFIARYKLGWHANTGVADHHAAATNGVRVNSHPKLVWGMRIIGLSMVVTWIVLEYAFRDYSREQPLSERVVCNLGFAMTGVYFALWSWQRPWDLKVVEREPGAHVSKAAS